MSATHSLQQAAHAMIAASDQGRPVGPVLRRRCPEVYRQVRADGKRRALLNLWGRSRNIDENTGTVIVHPAIAQALGTLAGVPMRGDVVHAGVEHTYGYLFSLIDTPYGRKRDRWLSTALEADFGLEPSLLGECPVEGTLLANLTWFLSHIVFRDRPRSLLKLAPCATAVARELVHYAYSPLQAERLVERVVLPGKHARAVALITDLVRYPAAPPHRESERLLIYSVQSGARMRRRLITAFPVAAPTALRLSAPPRTSWVAAISPRYNAYVPGWHGSLPGLIFAGPSSRIEWPQDRGTQSKS